MIPEARAFYQEGVSEAQAGNYDAAEFFLLKSIEIDATGGAYASLGWLYGSVLKQEHSAFRCFRNAIRLNSENGDHFNDCGALLLKAGRARESVKWFLRALRCPECTRRHLTLYNLAIVYRRWNRPERSRRFLNLALKIDPEFARARAMLKDIEGELSSLQSDRADL
ncbi:MAG: hypothetical protein K1X75_05210 [Leptospirales bacterium]|nr:hypothetical protein [Leptospirales bacterium]